MTHFPPDPDFGDVRSATPERKAPPASVLAAPRNPLTRWNRKYLLAGAAALASIVGLGFYIGFGGANASPKRAQDLQAAADADNPQQPEIASRYAQGYADPAVKAAETPPGVAALPPPGGPAQPPAGARRAPAPRRVDPAVVEAGRPGQGRARSASPLFASAPGRRRAAPDPPALPSAFVAQGPGGPVRRHSGRPAAERPGREAPVRRRLTGRRLSGQSPARPTQPVGGEGRDHHPGGPDHGDQLRPAGRGDRPGHRAGLRPCSPGRTVLIPQGSRLIGQHGQSGRLRPGAAP